MPYLQDSLRSLITYDTHRYDFRSWASRVLNCPDLDRLHQYLTASQRANLESTRRAMVEVMQNTFGEIHDCFVDFIDKEITPHFGHLHSFQDPPIFRVHFHGFGTISPFHLDQHYSSKPNEPSLLRLRNIWIPLTEVRGNNSLWLEQTPGQEDFQAVELVYGQALVFNATSLQHGSQPNDSGLTRVSFEFRVSPCQLTALSNWTGLYYPTGIRRADKSWERGPSVELLSDGTLLFEGRIPAEVAYAEADSQLRWTSVDGTKRAEIKFHQIEPADGATPSGKNFTGTLTEGDGEPRYFSGQLATSTSLAHWAGLYTTSSLKQADGAYIRGPVLSIGGPDQVTLDGVALQAFVYNSLTSTLEWSLDRNGSAGRIQLHWICDHGPQHYSGPAFYGTLQVSEKANAVHFSGLQ